MKVFMNFLQLYMQCPCVYRHLTGSFYWYEYRISTTQIQSLQICERFLQANLMEKFCKTLLLLFEKYRHMNMKNNDYLKSTNKQIWNTMIIWKAPTYEHEKQWSYLFETNGTQPLFVQASLVLEETISQEADSHCWSRNSLSFMEAKGLLQDS